MEFREQKQLILYTISVLWIFYAVGFVRCEEADEYPEMKLIPSTYEVVRFENESYIVKCQANNTRLRWLNPRNIWIQNQQGRVYVDNYANETILVFRSISMHDNGEWVCEAEQGNRKTYFRMVVSKPIMFVDTPAVQNVKENEDAFIKCMTTGDPEPTISWYFNGGALDIDNEKFVSLADGLTIKKVLMNDSGEYTCKAFQISSSLSNVKEQTIRLNVQHKPVKLIRRESADTQYGYLNGYVNVTCEAQAEPHARFTWYRFGKELHPKKHRIINGEHISILQLYLDSENKLGNYECEATNELGTLKRTIDLINGTRPARPAQIILRGVNSNTFDLDVGAKRPAKTTAMDVTAYRFEIIPKEEFEYNRGKWATARVVNKEFTDGVTFLVNELSPNTTYLVRVAAKNIAGLSEWMGPKEFQTHAKTFTAMDDSSATIVPLSLFTLLQLHLIHHLRQFY